MARKGSGKASASPPPRARGQLKSPLELVSWRENSLPVGTWTLDHIKHTLQEGRWWAMSTRKLCRKFSLQMIPKNWTCEGGRPKNETDCQTKKNMSVPRQVGIAQRIILLQSCGWPLLIYRCMEEVSGILQAPCTKGRQTKLPSWLWPYTAILQRHNRSTYQT